jgi:hypothetical protein
MKRTQVQRPDPLYRQVKRLAEAQDWSITEVLRRGAEYMVRVHPLPPSASAGWRPPEPLHLGAFRAPVETWRDLTGADEAHLESRLATRNVSDFAGLGFDEVWDPLTG